MRQTYTADRDVRDAARARAFFVELEGHAAAERRAAEIAALPAVVWKGKTLRTLRCTGTTGKGPHDQHVTEGQLWALISLTRWRCAFHPAEI